MKLISFAKLLKSDTTKDSFYSISGQAVAAISGAAFFAFAARLISLTDFGILSLSLATSAIIKDIIDPSLNSALIKFISQGKDTAKHVTRYVFQIKLLYFGVVLGVGFLFPGFLSRLVFKEELRFVMLLTFATSAIMSLGSMLSGFLQGHKMFLQDAVFVASQPLFRLVVLGIAYYFGYTDLTALLVINALAYLVEVGLFASFITAEHLSGEIPTQVKSSANKFIGPLTISTITGTLTDRVGLYITNYLLGPAQVGLLAAVLRLFIPAKQIAGVLNAVFGARFASFSQDTPTQTYLKKSILLILPIGAAAIGVSMFSPQVLAIMYGPEYVSAAIILQIVTCGFVAFLLQVPFVAKLIFYKARTDIVVYISFIQLILTMVLNWWFISRYGLVGAAWAIAVIMVIVALSYTASSQLFESKRK